MVRKFRWSLWAVPLGCLAVFVTYHVTGWGGRPRPVPRPGSP